MRGSLHGLPRQEARIIDQSLAPRGDPAPVPILAQPRAVGALRLSARRHPEGTRLGGLRQSGALRALFPRRAGDALEAIVVNTAGGVTGGDRLAVEAAAEDGAHLTLTTQAAERAYRAQPGSTGTARNTLCLGQGARLAWLPQETILYDGCALSRSLHVEMAPDAAFTMVEALVFGRAAMGETLRGASFRDRVDLRRDGATAFRDGLDLSGDVAAHLARPAVAGGAGAMASVLHAAPGAAAHLASLRALLPSAAGASEIREDLVFVRVLAPDGHRLRAVLVAVVALLTGAPVPRSWTT